VGFDAFFPVPPLNCPKCRVDLDGWQGKDGPTYFLKWVQEHAEPQGEARDDEYHLPREMWESRRLPPNFWIYTTCRQCSTVVYAIGGCEGGVWKFTDLFPDETELPDGWRRVWGDAADPTLAELRRETRPGHVLHGLEAVPIARREDRDDVLFRVYGAAAPYYVVHLTWNEGSEPPYPHADPIRDLDEFRHLDE